MSWRTRLASCSVALLAVTGMGVAPASAAVVHAVHAHAVSGLKLKNAGYLTVGSDTTYPPMESQPRPGQFQGADIDLANALAKAMGLKGAKIVDNDFNTIIPALQRGNFDVIMSSMNDTPARDKQIAFVDYMRASEGIVVRSSSKWHTNSYSGMCGATVAVESGTTEQDGLNSAAKRCHGRPLTVKVYTQDTAAFQAFASGHADAYSGDLPVCALYVKAHSGLRLAGKPFGAGEDYGIGLSKHNTALKSALTKALKKIKSNGEYARILSKWGVGGAGL